MNNWSLEDWANFATAIGLPLAIFSWLFTRESFAQFWKRRAKIVFPLVTMLTVYGLWRFGWLNWLAHRVSVPIWVFILIGLLFVAVVWLFVWLLSHSTGSDGTAPNLFADPEKYRTDEIFGVRWNWSYVYGKISENSFSAFCPRQDCKHRLDIQEDYHRGSFSYSTGQIPVSAICPRCAFRQNFEWNRRDLLWRVSGEIERRINTGEYARPTHA